MLLPYRRPLSIYISLSTHTLSDTYNILNYVTYVCTHYIYKWGPNALLQHDLYTPFSYKYQWFVKQISNNL